MRSVSVVVCTRDRPAALTACLRSLAEEPATEVLVVDNGSSPPTAVPGSARVVVEPRAGLARARNVGLAEARSEVVLFLDDDVTVRPGLVAAHAATYAPGVVAVGGPILFATTRPRPGWCDPHLDEMLSVIAERPVGVDLTAELFPYGANLSVDRAAAWDAGGFDTRLGRVGRDLASGEEHDLLLRLVAAGGRVRWSAEASVDHHISSERLRPQWFARRAWAQGRTDIELGIDQGRAFALRLAWTALRPGGTPWRDGRPPALPARLMVELARRIRLVGAAVALARR